MTKIPNARIRHQSLLATTQELIEQWQVRPVVQHIRDQNQIETIGLGEKIRRVNELYVIELGIRPTGGNRQRIQVASHHFQRPGLHRGDPGHAGACAEIQHALALDPLREVGEVTRHRQATGPAEAPVRRFVQNPPGFFRAERAIHVVAIDQPQLQVGPR
ncbi:hypothetical protein D3C81_1672980 [compost metagenome]